MNERLKTLRKSLDLTQAQFAERVGVKPNTISQYESGRNNPTDAVLALICREYGVNEVWLRTGIGPMLVPRTRRDDLFDFARRILGGELSDLEAAVVTVLAETTEEEWQVFDRKLRALYAAWQEEQDAAPEEEEEDR